ncbi:UNVERIFIED_CONTAM: hypothetical protein Sradi_3204800 [Sesamum radiatum]|uniref:Uncharacterized protein n=1 Tax=Sesamum radiatum TaxID=300843 RepID=A0AAW2RHQ7_SESRA
MHLNDEGKIHSDPSQELDDLGSSSSSTSCFFTSTEQSETSSDASISEVVESGTSISPDKAPSVGIDSGISQIISDSNDADVPRPVPPVYSVNHPPCSNKIQKMLAPKPDESITSTSSKDKREEEGAVVKEFVLHAIELRNSQSPTSLRTSADEDWKNQPQPSISKVETSVSRRASGNHRLSNVELSSECSKSLKMPSMSENWKNKSQISNGKGTRPTTSRSSGNCQELPTKVDSTHAISSDGGVRILSESTGKSLKTSVRKFVQHFRAPKQSTSFTFDMVDDYDGNYNHKVIFPFKLFMQLYACDNVELHPFGLVNCGNRQTPRRASFVRNSSVYLDGKIKRNMAAISSSNGAKKKNSKTKPNSPRISESTITRQGSDKHYYWTSPNHFTGNHVVGAESSEFHSKHRNPIVDSSSDSSSIFSASDAGSYSTDSTKDSSAEDISGYLFGSSWHHP